MNNDSIDFYIEGIDNTDGEISFFIEGIIINNTDINLVTKGIWTPTEISCPILDPLASIQISSDLIQIYQSRIDALINQLGKNVYLVFDPIKEPCTNCYQDVIGGRSTGIYKAGGPIPFTRGQKCPYCKSIGYLERENIKCIKCLIKWSTKTESNFGVSVEKNDGIVRLKTFLTSAPDLIKCKYAIVNHDIENILRLKVRLIQGPIPVGLREDRFCITFWEMF